jgi:tripartite-type tricarboxylate transporter receptor subunit TctC
LNLGRTALAGISAPTKIPDAVIDKLNKEFNLTLADPQIAGWLADLGGTMFQGSPADFSNLISSETEKWSKVVRYAGIKPDYVAVGRLRCPGRR